MPLYEYYCKPCNGVFELLRPLREATQPQPCPECDGDAKRIVSKEWGAFIERDGMPRRLPDRGKFWNLFEEADTPMTTSHLEPPEAKPRYVKKRAPAEEPSDGATVQPRASSSAEDSDLPGVLKIRRRRARDGG